MGITVKTLGPVESTPALANGRLYVVSSTDCSVSDKRAHLQAFQYPGISSRALWKVPFGTKGPCASGGWFEPPKLAVPEWSSPAIGSAGDVYFGTRTGLFYSIKQDGRQNWMTNLR